MTHHTDADLLPCPFCGAGITSIRENGKMWTGQRYSEPTSVSVMHHCEPVDGHPSLAIERVGRDMKSAVAAWNRRAPAAPVPQIDPVHGDCLPPIGSRVFIRHGRDDDAHACIVTGYYAWGDLKGSKHLHRVFVRLVYEGTDTKQARMLCDCYATAEDALAAAPRPPEAALVQLPCADDFSNQLAALRDLFPIPAYGSEHEDRWIASISDPAEVLAYVTEQVRDLLAAHGLQEQST